MSSSTGWLERIGQAEDAGEALVFGTRSIDYAALTAGIRAVLVDVTRLGVRSGDRVALLAPPCIEGVMLIHALLDRGIVMMPLNARLAESEQVFAIRAARARFLVVAEPTEDPGRRLAAETGVGLLRLETQEDRSDGADRSETLVLLLAPRVAEDEALLEQRAALRELGAALVLFTSGTSGRSKGALLALDNLVASAEASIALLGSEARDRWLLCMPLFHIGGLSVLIRSAVAGTSVVLQTGFDAAAVDRALDEQGICQVSLVATMLARLLDLRGEREAPESLRLVLLGGGPAAQTLLERARRLRFPVAPTYGLTEASSQVATRPPQAVLDDPADLASGLVPLPGVRVRIVGGSGEPLEPGRVGEIEVSGPIVMRGYLDDAQATARTLREGWLSTGDLGRLDPRGALRVVDRRSDLILSGGENIYPAEIESVIAGAPGVAEAGVVGVPDADFGERPAAFVVADAGAEIDRGALLEWCRGRLARYKLPVEWVFVDALPRTASGKLLRRALRERRDRERPRG